MTHRSLALVLLFGVSTQAATVTFHRLSLGGEAENGVFSDELTGSGRRDLIALAAGRISIFRADPRQAAGFAATPETLITGSTAYFADVADVLPDQGKEILILTPDGIWCFAQEDGRFDPRPRRLIPCETILSMTSVRGGVAQQAFRNVQVLPWNFAFDADGDGAADIVVPHDKGTDVYLQKPRGQFAKAITLRLSPLVHHFAATGHKADEFTQPTSRSCRVQVIIPPLESRDVNGDGKADLLSVAPWNVWFAQKTDGGFDPTPAELPAHLQSPVAPNIRLVDVNGDGHADRFEEENVVDDPLNIVTRVRVFLADGAGRLPESPNQALVDQNVLIHTNLPLHDFDGDGALDFAMYKTDITVTEIAKWIRQCFGEIEGRLNFYLFDRASNSFPRSPAFSKPVKMTFKVDLMEAMMGLVWERYLATMMRFEGDYNGDRRLDLLVRETTEQISIYFNSGDRRRLLSRSPDITLTDLPPFAGLALNDLNGDGCTDLLLYAGNYDHVVAVYVSKKQ